MTPTRRINVQEVPTIRSYDDADDAVATTLLWTSVFDSPAGGQTIEWLFRDGPGGDAPRMVAECDGQVVAHAGCVPIRFVVEGADVLAGYSVAAMTHPAARGRGLYVRLGEALYQEMERRGFAFVAGFSNRNSLRLSTGALGRRPVQPFPWCVKLLRPIRALRIGLCAPRQEGPSARAFPPTKLGNIVVEEGVIGSPELDSLWPRVRATVLVGAVRDASYNRWRFGGHPDAGYRLLLAREGATLRGYCVFRLLRYKGVNAAFLMDMLLEPDANHVGAALLMALGGWAKSGDAALMSALLPGSGPVREALGTAGYHSIPALFHPHRIVFSVRGLGRFSNSVSSLSNPHAWFLTWADTDIV